MSPRGPAYGDALSNEGATLASRRRSVESEVGQRLVSRTELAMLQGGLQLCRP